MFCIGHKRYTKPKNWLSIWSSFRIELDSGENTSITKIGNLSLLIHCMYVWTDLKNSLSPLYPIRAFIASQTMVRIETNVWLVCSSNQSYCQCWHITNYKRADHRDRDPANSFNIAQHLAMFALHNLADWHSMFWTQWNCSILYSSKELRY